MHGWFKKLPKGRRAKDKGQKTAHRLPFALSSHSAGTKMLHCTGRMTKGQDAAGWNWTQTSGTWCYSTKKSRLEEVPATMLFFSPKQACALQSSLQVQAEGQPVTCSPHCWQPHWQAMNSSLLLDANPHPPADFPEAFRLWTCVSPRPLQPRPAQTIHGVTSQGAGPPRAITSSATWGHLHHSCCLRTSRVRGRKQEKWVVWWAQAGLSRTEFIPEFAPGGKGKFSFKSLQTWKKKQKTSNSLRRYSPKQAHIPVFQL